jgi:hypothetical protein
MTDGKIDFCGCCPIDPQSQRQLRLVAGFLIVDLIHVVFHKRPDSENCSEKLGARAAVARGTIPGPAQFRPIQAAIPIIDLYQRKLPYHNEQKDRLPVRPHDLLQIRTRDMVFLSHISYSDINLLVRNIDFLSMQDSPLYRVMFPEHLRDEQRNKIIV